MMPRLKNMYEKEILPKLMAKLNYKNKHQAPKVIKVVLNVGLGEDATDSKKINNPNMIRNTINEELSTCLNKNLFMSFEIC